MSLVMNEAQAHLAPYMHTHPHEAVSFSTDLILTVLYLGGMFLLAFLSLKLISFALGRIRDRQ